MKTEQDYQRVYAGINLDAVMHNLEKDAYINKRRYEDHRSHQNRRIWSRCRSDCEKNRKSPISLGICSGNTAGGNGFKKTWNKKAGPDLRPQL